MNRKAQGGGKKAWALTPVYNRAADIRENKGQKRYDYGLDNLLPNQLLRAIESSVTASACRFKKSEFIEGNGVASNGVSSMRVNPAQSADALVCEVADYAGIFDGFALAVKYNPLGEVGSVYALPFEKVRRLTDGTFYLAPKLNEGQDKKSDRIIYHPFNPREEVAERLARVREQVDEYGEQVGDIIYSFGKRAGMEFYPIPAAWAGMEEIEADAALGRLDWRNVKKGFRPDAVLTTIGALDDTDKDERGYTEQDYFDKNMMRFTGEDASPILHIQVDTPDQKPDLQTFDQEKLLNSTSEAADRIGRRVCRAMGVPDILVGFARAGQLGNVQELVNTLRMFQQSVGRVQRQISRALEMVWPSLDWTIEPLSLINDLPSWLIEQLTEDEIREMGGYGPLEEGQQTIGAIRRETRRRDELI